MVRERRYVVNKLDCLVGGGVAADSTCESDGLAGDLAMEGAEDQLVWGSAVEDVEP